MPRFLVVPVAVAALVLAVLPNALAKERVRARIDQPRHCPAAGQTVTVRWTLTTRSRGRRVPFGAADVYLKAVRRARGAPIKRFARSTRRGHYRARLTAPKGGIRRLEIWLAGVRRTPGGKSTRADVSFPVSGDPCRRG